jgi:mono/diheme cytochrome c family protein
LALNLFEEPAVRFKESVAVWMGVTMLIVSIPGLIQQALSAQAASSTRDGAYTVEQAEQGKALYQKQCATCHGNALEGMGKNAPLTGNVFLDKWTDQTLADIFMKINTTMPASAPGTMTPDETSQVLAYILSMNKFQTGKNPLPTDPDSLGAIHITKP